MISSMWLSGSGKVHAAPTVVVVDPARRAAHGIRPVVDTAGDDATEDLVEVVLANQERVVLLNDLVVHLVEIERDAVVHLDDEERPVDRRRR